MGMAQAIRMALFARVFAVCVCARSRGEDMPRRVRHARATHAKRDSLHLMSGPVPQLSVGIFKRFKKGVLNRPETEPGRTLRECKPVDLRLGSVRGSFRKKRTRHAEGAGVPRPALRPANVLRTSSICAGGHGSSLRPPRAAPGGPHPQR
jgi:hypothetical protein